MMDQLYRLIDGVNAGDPVAIIIYAMVMIAGISGICWYGSSHVPNSDARSKSQSQYPDRRGMDTDQ